MPVAGGNTDVGVGLGFFSALTRDRTGAVPYAWNIEAAWFASARLEGGSTFTVPYNDGYAKITVTRLFAAPLRLDIRPSFTDEEILYYHGMGNASVAAPPPQGHSARYVDYGRVHPSMYLDVEFRIRDHVIGKLSARYTASWLHVAADSKLAADQKSASPEVRALVGSTEGRQSVTLFGYGVVTDTRDDETSPHSGTWDEATIAVSPGGTPEFPYRYAQATVVLRGYVALGRRLTLAARAVGDLLLGRPPFVELPRFGDTYAVGGSNGVRGVPAQRYYGKVKAFGNVEVRARFFDFRLLGKLFTLGGAGFFDAGRVWADTTPQPELDGTGLGLKYGVGGGLRLLSGSAFVMRADVAWSPDATPVGAYVAAGEMF